MLKYFYFSFWFTAVFLICGVIYGYSSFNGDMSLVSNTMMIIVILAVLEIGLSFDNAVVNSKVLMQMDKVWIKRFLTYGIWVSVFGVRLVFPILIVSVSSMTNPLDILNLALFNHEEYAQRLLSTHYIVSGFGGMFLLLVGFHFFFDVEKNVHWIWFEQFFNKSNVAHAFPSILAFVVSVCVMMTLEPSVRLEFLVACVFGFLAYEVLHAINGSLGANDDQVTVGVTMNGIVGFIYINVLDTSFSFDGIMGAIAISNDIIIITLGLGIGAVFVRSLTIFLVEKGVLNELIYVEHGAFWSITVLGVIMMVKTTVEMSELATALITVSFVTGSIIHSIIYNRRYGSSRTESE